MDASREAEIIVCIGGDCGRSKGHHKLLDLAATVPGSATVPCQGICKGPVVGVRMRGGIRWYKRVRGERRGALARFVRTGSGRKALRSAEARRRRDIIRHRGKLRPLVVK
ncbi:MAG TPA: hypothetical protein VM282_27910 [Acidimicrobiales bacterium]|nr:hypothetical protein [Acidimicrobiales bacterium]